MLPVASCPLLGKLGETLPLDLLRASVHYLDAKSLFFLAETSRGGKWLVDDDAELWRGNMARSLPPPFPVPGAPQPFMALLLKDRSTTSAAALPDLATTPPCRPLFASVYRLRARAVRNALAPLLGPEAGHDDDDTAGAAAAAATGHHHHQQQASAPCLVSQYFQAHDALAVLRALGEAADALLQQRLRRAEEKEKGEEGEAAVDAMDVVPESESTAAVAVPLAPVALVLALHILHRLVQSEGSAALDGWRRWALTRLAGGPFVGMANVAFWTMGSHNPFGFRARDVLRTEKCDVRTIALGILQRAAASSGKAGAGAAGAIPSSERPVSAPAPAPAPAPPVGGDAGARLLARLESLRGIMPVSALDPPVVFVEALAPEPYWGEDQGGGVGRLVKNAAGHFELSSSPPRR